MRISRFSLAAGVAFMALAACLPAEQQAGAQTGTPSASKAIVKLAGVKRIEIAMLESSPVQVRVAVYGWMSDACTNIRNFKQTREESVISLKIFTERPGDAICAQVIKDFRETYPVDTRELPPGIYTLDVNGTRQDFTLP